MLLNTVWFRLIPHQRCIFSLVLPWVSDIRFHGSRAVLIFMSRDMKTKQCQNKYFTFPRKLTHKPLLHATVCKVQSTHQAGTKPWAHTLLGQKPHRIHSRIAASKGNCIRAKADSNTRHKYLQSHLHTRVNLTAYRYLVTFFLLAFAGKLPQRQHDNMWTAWVFFSISSYLFKQMLADGSIAGYFYSPGLTTINWSYSCYQLRIFLSAISSLWLH